MRACAHVLQSICNLAVNQGLARVAMVQQGGMLTVLDLVQLERAAHMHRCVVITIAMPATACYTACRSSSCLLLPAGPQVSCTAMTMTRGMWSLPGIMTGV